MGNSFAFKPTVVACTYQVKGKSAYEPSDLSGQSLTWFPEHEATRSISTFHGMLVLCKATPSIKFASTQFYTWVKRGTVKVKCLAQKHNAMASARTQAWTTWSRDKCTNHEATVPPSLYVPGWCLSSVSVTSMKQPEGYSLLNACKSIAGLPLPQH